MRSGEQNIGSKLISSALAITIGVGALIGCSTEQSPAPGQAKSADTLALIEEGPISILKDQAMDICATVNDTTVDSNAKEAVHAAREQQKAINNVRINQDLSDCIDGHIADIVAARGFVYYESNKAPDPVASNDEFAGRYEFAVDLIVNPEIKALADKQLDYAEAIAAVRALQSTSPRPNVTAGLNAYIEDPEIKQRVERATVSDPNTGFDGVYNLETDKNKNNDDLRNKTNEAFGRLYQGSNTNLQHLNRDIKNFNEARQRDGQ